MLNNPGNTFQNFTLQSLGGNVDVQGASTHPPADEQRQRPTTRAPGDQTDHHGQHATAAMIAPGKQSADARHVGQRR